ncbi:hypothetical protein GBA52_014828 [Prunus armeniaca]|nr:hypothetical protein GBA52_014828 [Prunus armeniaca]
MDSGMDCPLAQVFKRRRVHKENEVTVLSQGADGDVVGNREGRVHLNQGVSEAALRYGPIAARWGWFLAPSYYSYVLGQGQNSVG